MYFTLSAHDKNYQLSCTESLLSICTLSGAPYSKRHWELAVKQKDFRSALGHRFIAILEAIPVIGGLAALIERVTAYAFKSLFSNPNPSKAQGRPSSLAGRKEKISELNASPAQKDPKPVLPLSTRAAPIKAACGGAGASSELLPVAAQTLNTSLEKMLKNSRKAISEHLAKEEDRAGCVTLEEMPLTELVASSVHRSLELSYQVAASFKILPIETKSHNFQYIDREEGTLVGIFDGYGNGAACLFSAFCAASFKCRFFPKLKELNRDIKKTFETLFQEIQFGKDLPFQQVGATAVISFIDKSTNLVYTATLGGCEAHIYRSIEGELKSIPLSCVRNWSSPKDAKRAESASGDLLKRVNWLAEPKDPKNLRYPPTPIPTESDQSILGVNVSRAIGLYYFNQRFQDSETGTSLHPLSFPLLEGMAPPISCKPKVTAHLLKPGDVLVLASDVLKQCGVKESEIITRINSLGDGKKLAEDLANFACETGGSEERITVFVIKVS